MNVGIVVFPGTNCDRDTKMACEFFGWRSEYIWHDETDLNLFDIIFMPGGFSYGDYIRAGRLAKFSPVVNAIKQFIENKKGFVVGICNGFQILCEANILPGVLSINDNTKFICEEAKLIVNKSFLPFNINLPIAHMEGKYIIDKENLDNITQKNMVLVRYEVNPNGSIDNIAGLYDKENGVIGLMPHPERAVFEENGNIDGIYFFKMLEKELNKFFSNKKPGSVNVS